MNLPIILFDFDGVIFTQKAAEYTALLHLRNNFYNWKSTEKMRLIDFIALIEKSDSINIFRSFKRLLIAFKPYIPVFWKRIIFFIKFSYDYRRLEKIHDGLTPGLEDSLIIFQKQGFILGIVSNTQKKRLLFFNRKLNLDLYFSIILSRGDVPKALRKPHPYPILSALIELKKKHDLPEIDKRNVYYIGDLPTDIECARRANVNSIALLSGHGNRKELENEKPTFTIEKIGDLLEIKQFKKLLYHA